MQRVILRPDNPDTRDIKMIAEKMNKGAVVIFPTDTVYAMGCIMTNKGSIDRIIKISGKKEKQAKLSLICKDIKTVADFTLPYSNHIFKSMKRYLPGPYTFILNANNFVTKYFKNNKKEIGIRIPDNKIVLELMEYLDAPIISTSLNNDTVTDYFIDPEKIEDTFEYQVDYLIDGGLGEAVGSTILDCTSGDIEVMRMGKGEVD
ncbi:MAG: tRNA threonylcarbamoyl adenosine modification protein (Sua5/YciO/YrdC/YwlC family) [Saprospiraceae bacterium]|jgi:tRNA threonylcarbamoyl adenosine modification protein (Sua5/YciO/YrdC/YwlC family)